jgi:hypothetical protein
MRLDCRQNRCAALGAGLYGGSRRSGGIPRRLVENPGLKLVSRDAKRGTLAAQLHTGEPTVVSPAIHAGPRDVQAFCGLRNAEQVDLPCLAHALMVASASARMTSAEPGKDLGPTAIAEPGKCALRLTVCRRVLAVPSPAPIAVPVRPARLRAVDEDQPAPVAVAKEDQRRDMTVIADQIRGVVADNVVVVPKSETPLAGADRQRLAAGGGDGLDGFRGGPRAPSRDPFVRLQLRIRDAASKGHWHAAAGAAQLPEPFLGGTLNT